MLQPLRTGLKPMADLVKPMSYLDMQRLLIPAFPIGYRYYWKGNLIREISDGAIEVLLDSIARAPTPLSSIGFQQIHGAAARVGATETAYAHRFPHHDFFPGAIWSDPADDERCIRWSRQCWEAMQPFVEKASYVNDLGEEPDDRVREAYGVNYERLVSLKKKYDPDNFFRMNQNIAP